MADKQETSGYAIVIIALLLLLWLLKNGNPFLHTQVSASVGGVPVPPNDFYSGANAPCTTC